MLNSKRGIIDGYLVDPFLYADHKPEVPEMAEREIWQAETRLSRCK